MKKTSLAISVGILALFLGGCPSSPPSEQTTQPSPVPSPSPSPQATSSPPPTFDRALQPGKTPTSPKVTGLIPATNPDQYRTTIKKGRNDPFAMLPVQPTVKFPNTATVPTLPVRQPSRLGVPSLPSRPSRPQPNEALAVVVTGVMDLPTSPVAIVKAPGESVSRRVSPGSTLSNGQVRVKAIYADSSNPMVVLEQYGMEVTRRVGEGAEVASVPGAI